MSAVFEGDEWKHCDVKTPLRLRKFTCPTRMALQHDLDLKYAFGTIGLAEWRREFDALSEPRRGSMPEVAA